MGKRFALDHATIGRLRSEVERMVDFTPASPHDFTRLSEIVTTHGCGYVSATTLKRIWGYITDAGDDYHPSAYSIRALCNLLGYRDIAEFENSDGTIQSKEYSGDFVASENIPLNATVELRWMPNRRCSLLNMGGNRFRVLSQENSHLQAEDIVECSCFTQDAPAYFTRVYHAGMPTVSYVAGSANGARYTIEPPL